MSTTAAAHQKHSHTHYDVLRLSRGADWSRVSHEDVKSAYRRALLIHHPDKAAQVSFKKQQQQQEQEQQKPPSRNDSPAYSIDDIVVAYEVLADPRKRRMYDETLDKRDGSTLNRKDNTHIGVEAFDLEDLQYDERKNTWSKSCRCGEERGYVLTETDLDEESQDGEIYVGCRGCSLYIKVLFALEEG
ncbi:hypothetical protein PV08_04651 [Exophiala spinifera]|uniref:Diphthamide biosynthesis protein 4 n=1 Tax=Exophiala spinifera TaxID=91928 RepID=A0A0D1ZXU7_9EURO|nr:uncharacterized protein PV08_04651 [Exophiala spinifera]KIW17457.1 hypothetical protein PV08_04651 [Exophiala spinifera]